MSWSPVVLHLNVGVLERDGYAPPGASTGVNSGEAALVISAAPATPVRTASTTTVAEEASGNRPGDPVGIFSEGADAIKLHTAGSLAVPLTGI